MEAEKYEARLGRVAIVPHVNNQRRRCRKRQRAYCNYSIAVVAIASHPAILARRFNEPSDRRRNRHRGNGEKEGFHSVVVVSVLMGGRVKINKYPIGSEQDRSNPHL